MSWTVIISMLLTALPYLIDILSKLLSSHGSLNPNQQAKFSRIMGMCDKIREQGQALGIQPEPFDMEWLSALGPVNMAEQAEGSQAVIDRDTLKQQLDGDIDKALNASSMFVHADTKARLKAVKDVLDENDWISELLLDQTLTKLPA